MFEVTVLIPTLPRRARLLARAVRSVMRQTMKSPVIWETDNVKRGPAPTRNRALSRATTEWVAFLDDDDEFYPQHVEHLWTAAQDNGADLVYPGYDYMVGGVLHNELDHVPRPFGQPFTPACAAQIMDDQNFIPVTVLVRRELLMDVGGFPTPGTAEWLRPDCEDWGAWQRLLLAGAEFYHLPERTWIWHRHTGNTWGQIQ